MPVAIAPMTTDEFLSLPDDDKFERWLVNGELRERPMSRRSPQHASAVTQVARFLANWCAALKGAKPRVYTGDIYFRLRRNPDVNVGIDVGVATAAQVAATPANARLIDGSPLLAVEVLSASDTVEDVQEKIDQYVINGTPVVWLVNPFNRTVTVFRPNSAPVLFNETQQLTSDTQLPGLTIPVTEIFAG